MRVKGFSDCGCCRQWAPSFRRGEEFTREHGPLWPSMLSPPAGGLRGSEEVSATSGLCRGRRCGRWQPHGPPAGTRPWPPSLPARRTSSIATGEPHGSRHHSRRVQGRLKGARGEFHHQLSTAVICGKPVYAEASAYRHRLHTVCTSVNDAEWSAFVGCCRRTAARLHRPTGSAEERGGVVALAGRPMSGGSGEGAGTSAWTPQPVTPPPPPPRQSIVALWLQRRFKCPAR